jgi:hypothetical protein
MCDLFVPSVLTTWPYNRCQTPKILAHNICFSCAVWNPMGNYIFLGQQLILFVRENYCNCASRGKFHANEFFKRTYKISKWRPQKRIFGASGKGTLHVQYTRCQRTSARPKLPT